MTKKEYVKKKILLSYGESWGNVVEETERFMRFPTKTLVFYEDIAQPFSQKYAMEMACYGFERETGSSYDINLFFSMKGYDIECSFYAEREQRDLEVFIELFDPNFQAFISKETIELTPSERYTLKSIIKDFFEEVTEINRFRLPMLTGTLTYDETSLEEELERRVVLR